MPQPSGRNAVGPRSSTLLVAPAGGRSELALLKERTGRVGVAELRRQVGRYRCLLELGRRPNSTSGRWRRLIAASFD
ncbi:MAG: hypothetical protein ACRDJ2_07175 [Actinomycetota bacterium]